ncbi:hypothetical protein EX30DRAFT_384848 [Ascodesmis nigricans]|uniref:Uncharacterized protein n=1 Tax=Ascodesmis nigricans TaxID=341454 RepID=A0A4S2MS55_9PEZI|nr:hypothetical protein EX30DRAFT_384848 [Ascodesmis nigricans]
MAVLSTLSAPLIPLLHLLHAFLLLAPAAALALPRSTQFITPDDETNNVCLQPASWNQVLSFFLTNYIARIATFKKTSGYEGFRDYVSTFASLFVPFVGISEAAATISRGSRWLGKDDVERALLAKALCVIVREPGWRPENEEIIRGCIIGKGDEAERRREQKRRRRKKKKERRKKGRNSFSSCTATLVMADPGIDVLDNPKKWKIQGYYSLPPMYTIAHLPPGTTLRPLSTSSAKKEEVTISNSYGVVKSFTGAIQIISSLYTLYTAYGDETDRYGYAAFGFSVLPYTIMSFMNTIANLVEATYDTLYLVRSDVMLEAERREHGEFIGEVAELVPASKATELEVAGMTTVDLRFLRRPKGKWVAVEVDDAGKPIDGGVRYKVNFPHDTAAYNPAKDPRDKILVQPVGQSYRFNYVKHKRAGKFQRAAIWVITLLSLVIPYIVIGALSKFNRGTESTLKQRVFMMGWLVSGQTIGVFDLVGQGTKIQRRWPKWAMVENFVDKSIVVVGFALAVGGFVQVGTMLRDFGYCVKV